MMQDYVVIHGKGRIPIQPRSIERIELFIKGKIALRSCLVHNKLSIVKKSWIRKVVKAKPV
jgi:hypothetical protein